MCLVLNSLMFLPQATLVSASFALFNRGHRLSLFKKKSIINSLQRHTAALTNLIHHLKLDDYADFFPNMTP